MTRMTIPRRRRLGRRLKVAIITGDAHAAGLLVPWGIDPPTIIVAANAQLLRRLRLRTEAG